MPTTNLDANNDEEQGGVGASSKEAPGEETATNEADCEDATSVSSHVYQKVDLDAPVESIRDTTTRRQFPDAFYDKITGEIMRNPVVNPAGDSYEKSTLLQDSSTSTSTLSFYPNRALQSIIQHEVELTEPSLAGKLRRANSTLKSGWGRLLEKSVLGTEYRPLPEGFYCPITCDLMADPVISKEGITYEREAIEQWIEANGKSPVTRNPIAIADLRDNNALYELIQTEKGRTPESIHPSVRRWKESVAATSRRRTVPSPTRDRASREEQHPPPSAPAEQDIVVPAPTQPAAPAMPGTAGTARNNINMNNNHLPTTEEELSGRRQQRYTGSQRCQLTLFSIVFTVIAFAIAPVFGIFALVLTILILLLAHCHKGPLVL